MPVEPIVMGIAYGDQWTNMVQPFWAIPLMGLTGVDVRQFADAAELGRAWRARQGIAPGVPVVLCLGRLCRRKNQVALVRAMARLTPRFPDAMLCLAGRGPDEDGLRRLARESGLGTRVRFEGAVDGPTRRASFATPAYS